MPDLFSPLQIGPLACPNRILMAPMMRCRADRNHVPLELMATYYGQRAGAGLIVAESTLIVPHTSSFKVYTGKPITGSEPGIFSSQQVDGWRRVTDRVHALGGRIILQLLHGGRTCHPSLNQGLQPVAPSPIRIQVPPGHDARRRSAHAMPRALADDELPGIVSCFQAAALKAMQADFDGVEIHAGNGYLLDTFLRDGSNRRTGPYGGSLAGRARLLLEVLDSVLQVCSLVGVRLSPLNSFNDMSDSNPLELARWLGQRLNDFPLAYLHLLRGDFYGSCSGNELVSVVRDAFDGVLIGNMKYTQAEANAAIESGKVDAVSFGKLFIANPDLPNRFQHGYPCESPDPSYYYAATARGYTDYPPFLAAAAP